MYSPANSSFHITAAGGVKAVWHCIKNNRLNSHNTLSLFNHLKLFIF